MMSTLGEESLCSDSTLAPPLSSLPLPLLPSSSLPLDSSLLTVNFRQPSYEFTFNVGIDLLF
jgi:hypothetical protein